MMANITSEFNGSVVGIARSIGERVNTGDTVIELHMVGLKVPIVAPEPGIIENICVSVGDNVTIGMPLFSIANMASDSDHISCPSCGVINNRSARFCSSCGQKLNTNISFSMPTSVTNNDFNNQTSSNTGSSYTQSTVYPTNNVTPVTKKKKHGLRNTLIVVGIILLLLAFYGNSIDDSKDTTSSESDNKKSAVSTENIQSTSSEEDKTTADNSPDNSSKEKDPNYMHDLNKQKTDIIIYGIDYYGYGIVFYSQDDQMYYLRCPYIEESGGETLFSTVRIPIDDDSITKYELSDGDCVKISSHMVDHMTNDKFWLLFDECTKTDTSFIYDIYNSSSYETLPSYSAFNDFCRYGKKGQMCLLSNVRVYSTDNDSYFCFIDYNPDEYDSQVSLHLLDSGNGVSHTRILPEDRISVFCHLIRIESSGVPTFELDYIIDMNGKSYIGSNQSTNTSPNTNKNNASTSATRNDVISLMWQDISSVVSTYGLSETPAGDGIISYQNSDIYVEANKEISGNQISSVMLNNDTYSLCGVYIGMDIGEAYDTMNSLGWEEIYLQYGSGVYFDSPDGTIEIWFMSDEDAKVSRIIASGL